MPFLTHFHFNPRLLVLVREHLLAALPPGHAVLLLLPHLTPVMLVSACLGRFLVKVSKHKIFNFQTFGGHLRGQFLLLVPPAIAFPLHQISVIRRPPCRPNEALSLVRSATSARSGSSFHP